jgi:hypothetical protein
MYTLVGLPFEYCCRTVVGGHSDLAASKPTIEHLVDLALNEFDSVT